MTRFLLTLTTTLLVMLLSESASGLDNRSQAPKKQDASILVKKPLENSLVRRYKTNILLNQIKKLAQADQSETEANSLLESFRRIRKQAQTPSLQTSN